MVQCRYRIAEYDCRINTPAVSTVAERSQKAKHCDRCIRGQIADEISLNTSAIMNMSMDKMEDESNGKTYRS